MLNIKETNFDYVFEVDGTTVKISKKVWKQLPKSKLGDKLVDGNDTVIFSKTSKGIMINKSFCGKNIEFTADEKSWQYIKNWIRLPEQRETLTEAYKKAVAPRQNHTIVPWNKVPPPTVVPAPKGAVPLWAANSDPEYLKANEEMRKKQQEKEEELRRICKERAKQKEEENRKFMEQYEKDRASGEYYPPY